MPPQFVAVRHRRQLRRHPATKPSGMSSRARPPRPHNPIPESPYEVLALFTGAMVGLVALDRVHRRAHAVFHDRAAPGTDAARLDPFDSAHRFRRDDVGRGNADGSLRRQGRRVLERGRHGVRADRRLPRRKLHVADQLAARLRDRLCSGHARRKPCHHLLFSQGRPRCRDGHSPVRRADRRYVGFDLAARDRAALPIPRRARRSRPSHDRGVLDRVTALPRAARARRANASPCARC